MVTPFAPLVTVHKSGDILTVMVQQKYHPRGRPKHSWRWVMGGQFSLRELARCEEK